MFQPSTKLLLLLAVVAVPFTACRKDKTTPAPAVNFLASTTSTVVGATVTFSNQTTGATAYLWKFGDGNGSTSTNATHVYDSIGTFKVTLVALGTGGTDSLSVSVAVGSGNITVMEGTGIKTTNLGRTWSSLKAQFGTDTMYNSYYDTAHKVYVNEVFYAALGVDYVFVLKDSVVALTDVMNEILVVDPFTGTSQKGISIGSSRGNVSYYYGPPSSISTSADNTIKYYDYSSLGITFWIDIATDKVVAMDIYAISKKKSGRLFTSRHLVSPKR